MGFGSRPYAMGQGDYRSHAGLLHHTNPRAFHIWSLAALPRRARVAFPPEVNRGLIWAGSRKSGSSFAARGMASGRSTIGHEGGQFLGGC